MKTCSKCKEAKSLEGFSRDARSNDGLRSDCKDCCRAYHAHWRAENTEKRRDLLNQWRITNPERTKQLRREAMQRSYARNPVLHRERSSKWATENKEARAATQSKRRAAGSCAWADAGKIREVYEFAHEFRNAGFDVEVDHIEPLQGKTVCGLHVEHNLRVCLADTNRSKGNRQMEHFQ